MSGTRAEAPWPRRMVALVRCGLLVVIGLCALAHGPYDDTHAPPRAHMPTSTVMAPMAAMPLMGDEAPPGPHRHHGGDECAADRALRTTSAETGQPPAAMESVPLAALLTVVRLRTRRPRGRRRTRTGRTALIRTSRWRI